MIKWAKTSRACSRIVKTFWAPIVIGGKSVDSPALHPSFTLHSLKPPVQQAEAPRDFRNKNGQMKNKYIIVFFDRIKKVEFKLILNGYS